LQKLLNKILSELEEEILLIQRSYSCPKAGDYATYCELVGKEEGLKRAKAIVVGEHTKWVGDEEASED
jgi:hypothetical protein